MTSTPVGMRCPECARQKTQVKNVNFGGLAGGAAPAVYALIAINVAAFLLEIATGGSFTRGGGTAYFDGALYGPAIADGGEVYRIVTSGFLHAGILHIGFNMYVLYVLGTVLEPGIGTPRFVGLYVASLLGGSFGALLLEPDAFTVGASGAVFGVMAATFVIARHRGIEQLAQQVGFFVVLNLVISFTFSGISIGAHIGGLITGGLAALAFTKLERRPGKNTKVLEFAVLIALSAIAVIGALVVAGN